MSVPRGPVRRAAAALLAAAAVVLAGAGCGGGADRSADRSYVQAVNAAQNDFADRFDRLSSRITSTSTPRQDRRTLAQFQVAVDRVVRRLRAVRPPERVRALHARLIAEISGYRAQIGAARRAFASRDPQRVLAAQGRLVGAVNATGARVNRTIDDINRRLREG
ncbi:MAG TPA: hypothetical protein VLA98_03750 [Solirubrobacteraceae bacterium]|nr:hypothetical protein [Solirubrobacteraceae bacterium]